MRHPLILSAFAALLLAGCAPTRPEPLEILVNTEPAGAACVLSRLGQPIATAQPSPAIALVDPAGPEITILCRRRGFADALAIVPPRPTSYSGSMPESALHVRADLLLLPVPHGPMPLAAGPR